VDRKLLDYLPPVLREVMEMQAINEVNEPEIAIAWDAITLVLANQFLETADVRGVSIWEKELKIFPKDTDTLAGRKARIKAMWNLEIPYTIPWLKNWLTGICGPEGHEETIADYTINIQLDYNVLPDADSLALEILKMLLAVRPSNMRVMLTAFLQSYGTISFGAAARHENHRRIEKRSLYGAGEPHRRMAQNRAGHEEQRHLHHGGRSGVSCHSGNLPKGGNSKCPVSSRP